MKQTWGALRERALPLANRASRKRSFSGLGFPLYVNGELYNEPVTISHVPGQGAIGEVDPSMGSSMGSYVAYAPQLGADDLPGSSPASLPPAPSAAAPDFVSPIFNIWKYVAPVSALACAYHGYKRNNSIGWALVWFLLGGIPVTPVIALAQGFGERKGLTPNRGLTRRQRGARKGAKTRAAGGTKLWDVIRTSTNTTVGTIVAPHWKTYEDVTADAQKKYGAGVYAAYKRKQNRRRR